MMANNWTIDSGAAAKYTSLFHDACAKAGMSSLDKANAGLHRSGLAPDVLMQIWALADTDRDDRLSLQEYLVCAAIVAHCVRTAQWLAHDSDDRAVLQGNRLDRVGGDERQRGGKHHLHWLSAPRCLRLNLEN